MHALGINLASSLLNAHGAWAACLPYAALVLIAIGLQYVQTRQVNRRTPPGSSAAQLQSLQRYLPLIYAVLYVRFPAGLNIYFVVSAVCRIAIQELALRPRSLRSPVPRRTRLAGDGET